jgi:hypothetical protein
MEPIFWLLRSQESVSESYRDPIQSTPARHISLSSILILHQINSTLQGLQQTAHVFLIFSMYSTHPTHLIFLDLMSLIIFSKEYTLWVSSLHNFLLSLVTSSLLGPNISVSILFSDILNLWSTLSMETHVLHAYTTAIIYTLQYGLQTRNTWFQLTPQYIWVR